MPKRPQITAERIAEATLGIGLDRATVRKVADRLGSSVPGLYHHVRNREGLLALAAAHSLRGLTIPETTQRDWEGWLRDFSWEAFEMLVRQPGMILQTMSGNADTATQMRLFEEFVASLVSYGFEDAEAAAVYEQVISVIVGAAALEIGHRAMPPAARRRLRQDPAEHGSVRPGGYARSAAVELVLTHIISERKRAGTRAGAGAGG